MGGKLPFFPVYHHRGKLSISNFAEAQKTPLRRQKQRGQGKEDYWFFTESWVANKDLGEAPKAARGRSMKARPTQSRKGVKGGLRPFSSAPCRVEGQRPLWGLGQRPNCFASNLLKGSRQQRCRQRSVPASNFARPQTRPQAALPPRFREEPKKPPKHSRVSEEERCIYRGSYFFSSIP